MAIYRLAPGYGWATITESFMVVGQLGRFYILCSLRGSLPLSKSHKAFYVKSAEGKNMLSF
jgi:hypothetical protein